ncbi:MAG: hypothetical protein ACE5OR_15210 [bacterium]
MKRNILLTSLALLIALIRINFIDANADASMPVFAIGYSEQRSQHPVHGSILLNWKKDDAASSSLRFEIPNSLNPEHLTLRIFNLNGQLIYEGQFPDRIGADGFSWQ